VRYWETPDPYIEKYPELYDEVTPPFAITGTLNVAAVLVKLSWVAEDPPRLSVPADQNGTLVMIVE
jgi:hypothetical protein